MPSCERTSPVDRVTIGVHVDAAAEPTLASITANTAIPHEILLLGNGPAAACFNQLASHDDAPVVVFLEAGVIVGPEWLDRLLAGLAADPRNGLAGPSTNNAWNEQRAFTGGGTLDDVARVAATAASRFGNETRRLAPLYSLADFCIAVRREVIDAIGAADEEYGLGPCWEMDYNARAARAGWHGVWVCGAYVYRPPFTVRRRTDEARLFDRNRRLYQDRFCGGRLRGEKSDYRTHCRGEDCPNFAPAESITVFRPWSAIAPLPEIEVVEDGPLVTCIMPTHDRREFIGDAIANFLRFEYPRRELLIVDDGADSVGDLIPSDARIRHLRIDGRRSVGAKRNLACDAARGEIIVHTDDDDWYPPWRLTAQVRALRRAGADICGTSTLYFLDRRQQRAWLYRYSSATPWLAGASLAYRREFWERNRFTDRNVGEDSELLWRRVPKEIHDMADPRLCVAAIHPANTASHETAGAFWREHDIEDVNRLIRGDEEPLVSCIMPTFNRRPFIGRALALFAGQDYPRRELVIVDDGDDAIGDLVAGAEAVRYVRAGGRSSIGRKRNIACEHARGEIIAHWDDDDWYAPSRLREQIAPIVAGNADLTGLAATCVYDSASNVFWTLSRDLHRRAFAGDVHGGTLVYRRSILRHLAYPDASLAEDAWLLRTAMGRGHRLLRIETEGLFVYTRHATNAWRAFVPGVFGSSADWQQTDVPEAFAGL